MTGVAIPSEYPNAGSDAAKIGAALNSGARVVDLEAFDYEIDETIPTIPAGVAVQGLGAKLNVTQNVNVFRAHGNARILGHPEIDVRWCPGWNKDCVTLDGRSETNDQGGPSNAQTYFRLGQTTIIQVRCLGRMEGPDNGVAVAVRAPMYGPAGAPHKSWLMGLDIDVRGEGFDTALLIERGGPSAAEAKAFANCNKAFINFSGPRQGFVMKGDGLYGSNNWKIEGWAQSRPQSEQTAPGMVIDGQHLNIDFEMKDWLGGPDGLMHNTVIRDGVRNLRLAANCPPHHLLNENPLERSNYIYNGWPGEGVSLGSLRAVTSDGYINIPAGLRFDNACVVKWRNAQGNDVDVIWLDAVDDLHLHGSLAADKNVIYMAGGGHYKRINGFGNVAWWTSLNYTTLLDMMVGAANAVTKRLRLWGAQTTVGPAGSAAPLPGNPAIYFAVKDAATQVAYVVPGYRIS